MMRNSVYLRQKEDYMETGVLKQEQIELPEYIEQKLTALAAAHGKSVKTFIEYLIIESVEALEEGGSVEGEIRRLLESQNQ